MMIWLTGYLMPVTSVHHSCVVVLSDLSWHSLFRQLSGGHSATYCGRSLSDFYDEGIKIVPK